MPARKEWREGREPDGYRPLVDALTTLSVDARRVLFVAYVKDQRPVDAARALGISEAQLKEQCASALAELEAALSLETA